MRPESGGIHDLCHNEKYALHLSLACPTLGPFLVSLVRLSVPSAFAEKRIWPQRRGLVVTHCHHPTVPVKRQQPIGCIIDATLINVRHSTERGSSRLCPVLFTSAVCVGHMTSFLWFLAVLFILFHSCLHNLHWMFHFSRAKPQF